MGKKKRKSEPGCIVTILGYLIFVCIIALIIDLIRTHISEQAKHNLMVVAIVIGVIIFISMVCTIYRKLHRKYTLKQLDKMDGHQFEYACADILKANGYKHVKVTRGSGDFGVDIIAEKDKVRYAIQCKRYNHKLDNTPIQEVVGGLAYYQCDKGAVMTNQYFTEPAKQLAQVNDIELLDRDTLSHMVDRTQRVQMQAAVSESEKTGPKIDSFQIYSTPEYAEKATMMNDLNDYPSMCEKFLNENAEYIVCYYKMTFDVDLKLEKIDVLYKQNSASFEFLYTPQLPISKLKKSLKDLSEYISIDNISLHSSCTTPGCFAIQMPMPDYLAKMSRFIDENSVRISSTNL